MCTLLCYYIRLARHRMFAMKYLLKLILNIRKFLGFDFSVAVILNTKAECICCSITLYIMLLSCHCNLFKCDPNILLYPSFVLLIKILFVEVTIVLKTAFLVYDVKFNTTLVILNYRTKLTCKGDYNIISILKI